MAIHRFAFWTKEGFKDAGSHSHLRMPGDLDPRSHPHLDPNARRPWYQELFLPWSHARSHRSQDPLPLKLICGQVTIATHLHFNSSWPPFIVPKFLQQKLAFSRNYEKLFLRSDASSLRLFPLDPSPHLASFPLYCLVQKIKCDSLIGILPCCLGDTVDCPAGQDSQSQT